MFGRSLIKYLFTKPLEIIGYFAILLYVRLLKNNNKVQQTKWEVSESTKKIVYEK